MNFKSPGLEGPTPDGIAKPLGGDFFDASAVAAYPEDFQLVEGHAEEIKRALANFKQY